MIADLGAGSFAEIWDNKPPGIRARFLGGAADLIMLGALLDDDHDGESLLGFLARLGAPVLAEHMLIRFLGDEGASRSRQGTP